jgi:putative transposase
MQKQEKSITNEKDLKPYYNDVCKEIVSNLYCPIGIDLSSLSSKPVVEKSWFSSIKVSPPKLNLPKTYYQFCTSLAVECTENEVIKKSKKIRITPTTTQKAILKHWFGVSRYVYNKTVEYLKQPNTKANWKEIKGGILSNLPEWAKTVPYQIKSIAVKDACTAVREAKKKTTNGQPSFVKFRSKKDRVQSFYVPSSAIKEKGVYHTKLGVLNYRERLPEVIKDSRLILHRGQYFLCVSTETQVTPTESQGGIVALDPGVRTFLTFYSPTCFGKLADGDFSRIQRLCHYLDQLLSKASKATSRRKRRIKKACDRMRTKIDNLIKEVHHQVANWLTKEFDVILLPTFETSKMSSRAGRKLSSKTVRAMLTWCHYRFQQFLLHKAKERNKTVLLVNESYTSKTVSWTGEIVENLGGRKKIKSPSTQEWMDRDLNGALGILLKALVDSPILDKIKSAFVNM